MKTSIDGIRGCQLEPIVANLNLLAVKYLLRVTFGWSRARIEQAIIDYLCFLQVIRNGTVSHCVPSEDVDMAAHMHASISATYAADCQALFGEPLDHNPFAGRLGPDDAARQAELYDATQRALNAL